MSTAEQLQAALDAKRKRTSYLRAVAALAGYEVAELADETFLCCRWGLASRPLSDLAELESYLRMVGIKVDA